MYEQGVQNLLFLHDRLIFVLGFVVRFKGVDKGFLGLLFEQFEELRTAGALTTSVRAASTSAQSPDEKAAIAEAAKQFNITPARRFKIVVTKIG
jgi:hypothetical protein